MQRLAEIDERQAGQSQQHQEPQESSYLNFLATQPPEFTETTDPLEANQWLRMTESKFRLLHYSEFQKTLFAAQQLRGSTSAWWATYTVVIQDNRQVSWNEFCTAFHRHHLPTGTMRRNLWEFLDLRQGTDNVYGYIEKCNYLAQYSTYHVDIDEKKAELFRRRLSLPLQDRLVRFQDMSFNALVSVTIDQDGTYRALLVEEEEKRNWDVLGPSEDSTDGTPPKYHLVYTLSIGKS
jgi:hypothetical protein